MNQITTHQIDRGKGLLRILQVIFTFLAFIFLLIGSVIMSVSWIGNGNMSLFGIVTETGTVSEGRFLEVVINSVGTLFIVWLLITIALLLAKQWAAAILALPAAFVILIVLYLFIVFILPSISGTIFVLLLVLLNGAALFLALWFLKRTSKRTTSQNKLRNNQ